MDYNEIACDRFNGLLPETEWNEYKKTDEYMRNETLIKELIDKTIKLNGHE